MNKARRHELKMLKFKKRMALYGLSKSDGKFYAFRSHSCPCSCSVCSTDRYNQKHTDKIKSLRQEEQIKELPIYLHEQRTQDIIFL